MNIRTLITPVLLAASLGMAGTASAHNTIFTIGHHDDDRYGVVDYDDYGYYDRRHGNQYRNHYKGHHRQHGKHYRKHYKRHHGKRYYGHPGRHDQRHDRDYHRHH